MIKTYLFAKTLTAFASNGSSKLGTIRNKKNYSI